MLIICVAAAIAIFCVYIFTSEKVSDSFTNENYLVTSDRDILIDDKDFVKMFLNIYNMSAVTGDFDLISGIEPSFSITVGGLTRETGEYAVFVKSISSKEVYILNTNENKLVAVSKENLNYLLSYEIIYRLPMTVTVKEPTCTYVQVNSDLTEETLNGAVTGCEWYNKQFDGQYFQLSMHEDLGYKILSDVIDIKNIKFDIIPDEIFLKVSCFEDVIAENYINIENFDMNEYITKNGHYYFEITAIYDMSPDKDYYGSKTFGFSMVVQNEIYFEFEEMSVSQGEFTRIFLYNAQEGTKYSLKSEKLNYTAKFFKVEKDKLMAFFPVNCAQATGTFDFELEIDGNKTMQQINVEKSPFLESTLTTDAATSSIISQAGLDEQAVYLTPLKKYVSSDEIYMSGPFIEPAQGKITTEFGSMRYTNGSKTPTRHNAMDIADRNMPDVLATNRGKVLLAMKMVITGNTVIIDHGMNVVSLHYHMDSMNVKKGDVVEKGDKIGVMGTTGYSTGVHLHFEIRINGIETNPASLFGVDLLK